jgi:hypothetical protein
MKKKKKNRSNTPRRKRMNKIARLASAKVWIEKYVGNNIVKGYSKWYGTSKLTAVNELKILGIKVSEEYIKQLKISEENIIKRNREKRRERELLKQIELNEFTFENKYEKDSDTFCILDDTESDDSKVLAKVCSKCCCCDDHYLPF